MKLTVVMKTTTGEKEKDKFANLHQQNDAEQTNRKVYKRRLTLKALNLEHSNLS